jgi:hypothetical protein
VSATCGWETGRAALSVTPRVELYWAADPSQELMACGTTQAATLWSSAQRDKVFMTKGLVSTGAWHATNSGDRSYTSRDLHAMYVHVYAHFYEPSQPLYAGRGNPGSSQPSGDGPQVGHACVQRIFVDTTDPLQGTVSCASCQPLDGVWWPHIRKAAPFGERPPSASTPSPPARERLPHMAGGRPRAPPCSSRWRRAATPTTPARTTSPT